MNRSELKSAREIADKVIRLYTEGKVDSVYIAYNEFKSVIAQRLVVDEVLPIARLAKPCTSWQRKSAAKSARGDWKPPRIPERVSALQILRKWINMPRNLASEGGLHL